MKDMSYKKREKIVPGFWRQKQTKEVKIGWRLNGEWKEGKGAGKQRAQADGVRAMRVSVFRFPDSLALF